MEIKNNTVSAAGKQRKKFLSTLYTKRKKIAASIYVAMIMCVMTATTVFAEGGGGDISNEGDEAFFKLVGFFATWIGRIGLLIAFVGGTMFGLAIKNDEADQKQRGLMTLAAGFIVYALTRSLNLFFPGVNIPLM